MRYAILLVAGFRAGVHPHHLAATPARWAVLTAKAAVVGAVTFSAGLVATALAALLLGAWAVGSLAVGVIILHRRDP